MDKRNLVEGLQKAFNTDDRQRNTSDTSDVEYKENTNTLYIKKQRTYNMEENTCGRRMRHTATARRI